MSEKKQKSRPGKPTDQAEPQNEAAPQAKGASEEPDASAQPAPEERAGQSGWAAGHQEALKAENADLKDRVLRMAAEMENLRKRTERDKQDTAKYAISNFARDMLTIADNLRRAIDHVSAEAAESAPALESFRDGVEVTERELHNVLERHGIARLDPKGERFDPNQHQAMFEVQNPDVAEGTVVEVVQPGYVIAERVLRPALVGIAKGGPKAARQGTEPEGAAPRAAHDGAPHEGPGEGGASPGGASPGGADTRPGARVDKSA